MFELCLLLCLLFCLGCMVLSVGFCLLLCCLLGCVLNCVLNLGWVGLVVCCCFVGCFVVSCYYSRLKSVINYYNCLLCCLGLGFGWVWFDLCVIACCLV